MQIVIDIDEDVFTRLFDNSTEDYAIVNDDLFSIAKSIRNCTPIPEPHGKIIDESKIKTIYYHMETSENERFHLEHVVIDGTDAPTIIEGSDCK